MDLVFKLDKEENENTEGRRKRMAVLVDWRGLR